MAWGIGGLGRISGGLRSGTLPTTVTPLSKLSYNGPKPILGTLASAFALKNKKDQLEKIPTNEAILRKERRTLTIIRPSVGATFSSPLSNPNFGLSRNVKQHDGPKVKHIKLYRPLPAAIKIKPYRPAWGAFKWA